jgi:hypothetical protein
MDKGKKQIVFFCGSSPEVMVYKIAREFKKNNYKTVLISVSQREKWRKGSFEDGFDKIICTNFQFLKPNFKNILNMLKRLPFLIKSILSMKLLSPYVIFGISKPNWIISIAIKFFKKYPFIYFPYDIFSLEFPNVKAALKKGVKLFEIKGEKYCFENADGVLHKGAPEEIEYLVKNSMFNEELKITPLRICFNPYCSDEFIVPINKNKVSRKDNSIHLVFIGGIHYEKETIKNWNLLFKKIIEQKIHIHLYVKGLQLSEKQEKNQIKKSFPNLFSNPYFHVNFEMDIKELNKEVSKYDYGIWVDCIRYKDMRKEYQFATGNKIACFFESGLPFFYNSELKYVDRLMKDYALNLTQIDMNKFNLKGLRNRLEKLNYKKLEKNVENARKDFNMKTHFPRLERFIEKVRKIKKQENI